MRSAAGADTVQSAASKAAARKPNLLMPLSHAIAVTAARKTARRGSGMVNEIRFLLGRFIESFRLKGC